MRAIEYEYLGKYTVANEPIGGESHSLCKQLYNYYLLSVSFVVEDISIGGNRKQEKYLWKIMDSYKSYSLECTEKLVKDWCTLAIYLITGES